MNQNITYWPLSIVILGSLVWLFLNQCISESAPCNSPTIMASLDGIEKKSSFEVGEEIFFSVKGNENIQSYQWEFGETETISFDSLARHRYEMPGEYIVKLLLNDQCEGQYTVQILESPNPGPIPPPVIRIEGPSNGKVGQRLTFRAIGAGANSWRWDMVEQADLILEGQTITYSYSQPGKYVISLSVNDLPDLIEHEIIIQNGDQCPYITDSELLRRFQNRVNYNEIKPFFDISISKNVTVNNNQTGQPLVRSLYEYCTYLNLRLDVKILEIAVARNSNKCIKEIIITEE